MPWCVYLTHPDVNVDPTVPVREWSLSPLGRDRAAKAAELAFAREIGNIVSSTETKAIQTAGSIASEHVVPFYARADLHENGRSATGYLPPEEFEETADRFFANPGVSIRGWERAVDAQRRIVDGVRDALQETDDKTPVLFTGHGAAGTLLMCHLMGLPIFPNARPETRRMLVQVRERLAEDANRTRIAVECRSNDFPRT